MITNGIIGTKRPFSRKGESHKIVQGTSIVPYRDSHFLLFDTTSPKGRKIQWMGRHVITFDIQQLSMK